MNRFYKYEPNYEKKPFVKVKGYESHCFEGWKAIGKKLRANCASVKKDKILVVAECYTGIQDEFVLPALLKELQPSAVFVAKNAMKEPEEIDRMVFPDVTDDEVFGYLTRLHIRDFFDEIKCDGLQKEIGRVEKGIVLIYGTGASLLANPDILLYIDMPRWEGQLKFRRNEVSNLGTANKELSASLQYKRAFFVDWRVCDRLKKELMFRWNYLLDTVTPDEPKLITGEAYKAAMSQVSKQPFRVMPFFDPGPWGGQWMKEVCDLDRHTANFAWCFDCVLEENSLLLKFGETLFETPAINLVFFKPVELLGPAVFGRFGDEFPIRFDFLDTMDGGNLSLQVHPLTGYIQEHFGMHYTQDESYYILDAGEGAAVYLGLKESIEPEEMVAELWASSRNGVFAADKHVKKWQVSKHDHILIPAGTVHCSGKNSMVLEISATPYIFTFKLWDWGRMGLDGKPRPINVERGKENIQWNRTPVWTKKNLINKVELIKQGDGWKEEKTGLHELEFIETRRHWFTNTVMHYTGNGVNVLNLVEGREVIVESPDHEFDAMIIHYAETFIIPASVHRYTIRPYGESAGKECATIKAFVRTGTITNKIV